MSDTLTGPPPPQDEMPPQELPDPETEQNAAPPTHEDQHTLEAPLSQTVTVAEIDGLPAVSVEAAADAPPFYTLDEDAIRAEIVAALMPKEPEHPGDRPPEKPPLFYHGEGAYTTPENQIRTKKQLDVLHERAVTAGGEQAGETFDWDQGRTKDVDKAFVEAHVERLYRIAAEVVWNGDESDELPKLRQVINPLYYLGAIVRGAKAGGQLAKIEWDAQTAVQIVGTRFDKMLTAAMPYVPKLEEAAEFLSDKLPLAKTEPEPKEAAANPEETEKLVADLKLDTQLAEQAAIWSQTGKLKPLRDGSLGIEGRDGRQYPMPTRAQLREIVGPQAELIRHKALQGFTRLILVPTALSNAELTEAMIGQTIAQHKAGKLHTADGQSLHLSKPLVADKDRQKELVQGAEKVQESSGTASSSPVSVQGWKVVLVKHMPEFAHRSEDLVFMGGRPEFLPGHRPRTYRETLASDKGFRGESGFSLPMWYAYAMTELAREGTLIDVNGQTLLIESEIPEGLFKHSKKIPAIGWGAAASKSKNLKLRDPRLIVQSVGTRVVMPSEGMRTAVVLSV